MKSPSWIMKYIVPASLILNIFAVLHISYCRYMYKKQDNTVHEIQLRPAGTQNNVESRDNGQSLEVVPVNTRRYNKILFQLNNMICFAVILIVCVVFVGLYMVITHNMETINYVAEYCKGFMQFFLFGIIIPCIFYIRNRDARMYIKELFCNA